MDETSAFIVGWEEWVALPGLGLPAIRAKVDTGARTSALHAFLIEPFGPPSAPMVRFGIHPIPGRDHIEVYCSAPVIDRREVTSSNGERESRFVIRTSLAMGARQWPIEVTLTNRESMSRRMLLGRQAIPEDMFVDPATAFRQPKLSYRLYRHLPRRDLVRRPLRIALFTPKPGTSTNRRLTAAAQARGHVLEIIDCRQVTLVFDGLLPGLEVGGERLAHYDAVIPRLGTDDSPLGPAAVRQLEMMGSAALNPGDSLDLLTRPLAVAQTLSRAGVRIRIPQPAADPTPGGGRGAKTAGSYMRILVVGGRIVCALQRRHGKDFDAGERGLAGFRTVAERAAATLQLGLARIDIDTKSDPPTVLRISADPILRPFEEITGARVAEAIIAEVEGRVRSWVRKSEASDRRSETAGET